ncbi:hypothetical protein [Klebsiella oxytoca]|uniref:hypothetical protein n=1 Tax=Klebsiella oxytoca TaxID=571 RepID=UPI003EE05A3D
MTSKLTRERVAQIYAEYSKPNHSKQFNVLDSDLADISRIALAAMDSEPVAEVCEDYAIRYISSGPAPKEGLHPGDKLYRHAQQPVVPDFETVLESLDYDVRCNIHESEHVYQASKATYGAFRAAMLNHPSSIQPNTDAATGTEIKHPSSNSPVIPDGYVMVPKEPTEAMINAWLSEVANWRGHVAGYKAMLATAPQEVKP